MAEISLFSPSLLAARRKQCHYQQAFAGAARGKCQGSYYYYMAHARLFIACLFGGFRWYARRHIALSIDDAVKFQRGDALRCSELRIIDESYDQELPLSFTAFVGWHMATELRGNL